MRHLPIDEAALQPGWRDHNEWLELLRPFIAVKALRLCWRLAGHVSLALEDIAGAIVVEVLPSLYSLNLEDQAATTVEQFTTVRRRSPARGVISFWTPFVANYNLVSGQRTSRKRFLFSRHFANVPLKPNSTKLPSAHMFAAAAQLQQTAKLFNLWLSNKLKRVQKCLYAEGGGTSFPIWYHS